MNISKPRSLLGLHMYRVGHSKGHILPVLSLVRWYNKNSPSCCEAFLCEVFMIICAVHIEGVH